MNITFTISSDLKLARVTITPDSYEYAKGVAREPEVQITLGGITLKKNEDYSVTYSNNILAGKATVKIVGKGIYTGTRFETFTINKAYMPSNCPNSELIINRGTYEKVGDIPLPDGWKWANSYANMSLDWVGRYDAIIAEYAGTDKSCYEQRTYEVYITLSAINLSDCNIELSAESYEYTGNAITPEIRITDPEGNVLIVGTHYSVEYSDNIMPGTGTAHITGIGYYVGEMNITFTILSEQEPEDNEPAITEDNNVNQVVIVVSVITGTTILATAGGIFLIKMYRRRRNR